jgi:hypothetical protein
LTLLLTFIAIPAAAQDDAPPVITAGNVRDLAPARTVRFDELDAIPDPDSVLPLSGWFTLSPDGEQLAFVIDGGIKLVDVDEGISPRSWSFPDTTVIDAHWDDASERLATVYEQAGNYMLTVATQGDVYMTIPALDLEGVPVRVWPDAENETQIWLELTPAPEDPDRSGFQVVRIDLEDLQAEPFALPTGPEHDFDSFVRIGRIPAPLAITATFAGTVRRWNLETGEVTAEVEMPVAPTFGRVNETNGVHFAWRDEMSTALHLLNFETGEDREIAPLDGDYIQALLLSPDASVILAVHRGETPDVTAWIVETGEEIALGEYDTEICSRVPDMVQLARSGTRLVIGCEDGFQVWEVSE